LFSPLAHNVPALHIADGEDVACDPCAGNSTATTFRGVAPMHFNDTAAPTERVLVVAAIQVAGFCRACEVKSASEVFDTLGRYYEVIGGITETHHGRVVKFMGDAALVVFPHNQAGEAVQALKDISSETAPLWREFDARCALQVTAHAGPVLCGPLGTKTDKRFDVIGKTVNELFRMSPAGFNFSPALKACLVE
jgi:class 3 adenylate cyclase